jgi:hypothetical protein
MESTQDAPQGFMHVTQGKHVQVGTDVRARLEKNKLYILTEDGQTCETHIRDVQEISNEDK